MLLEIDIVTILAEILNFLILAIALYFILFKPMTKRINERTQKQELLLAETQDKHAIAEKLLSQIKVRMADIDNEIDKKIQTAYLQAQEERESLLKTTQEEAEQILSEAENEAAKRQQQEMGELQERLVDTILSISGQILSRTTPENVHEYLIKELTTEIWDLGKNDMRQVRTIRDSLSERTPTVHVTTAKELTPDQQRSLVRTFSALADNNVTMEIELNPSLISGLRVRLGDLIVENTLAMTLDELRAEVSTTLEESFNVE